MSEPVFPLPSWATTPVMILKRGGKEIEVKGEYYVQVKAQTTPSCNSCVARPTGPQAKLCDVICPYCAPGMVFAQKVIR